jgi:hypothetical protein
MEYLLELYDDKGACIQSFRCGTPMRALEMIGEVSNETGRFEFVTATCYLKGLPQWELEIK